MHGGDCGSSVCRGGLPTHRRTRGRSMMGSVVVVVAPAAATGAAVVEVVVVGTSPSAPAPLPMLLVCSSGACLICWVAWGAYSAMAGGPDRAAVTVNAATSTRMPAVNAL